MNGLVRLTAARVLADGFLIERLSGLHERYPGLDLNAGIVGTVLEVLDNGDALLVEFGSRGNDRCDWLGVLQATEVERVAYAQTA